MALTYVLDEHLRGALWHALRQHNAGGVNVVDVDRVGDPPDLPLGTTDPDLLLWAEREGRVVVTQAATPRVCASCPPGYPLKDWVFHLVLVAYACRLECSPFFGPGEMGVALVLRS
jgi:hypothetical protein